MLEGVMRPLALAVLWYLASVGLAHAFVVS
jgi:hypothetical protein